MQFETPHRVQHDRVGKFRERALRNSESSEESISQCQKKRDVPLDLLPAAQRIHILALKAGYTTVTLEDEQYALKCHNNAAATVKINYAFFDATALGSDLVCLYLDSPHPCKYVPMKDRDCLKTVFRSDSSTCSPAHGEKSEMSHSGKNDVHHRFLDRVSSQMSEVNSRVMHQMKRLKREKIETTFVTPPPPHTHT